MALVYADLHIHIGRTSGNKPVKITASPALTLQNIAAVAQNQKGGCSWWGDCRCGLHRRAERPCRSKGQGRTSAPCGGGGALLGGLTIFFRQRSGDFLPSNGRLSSFLGLFSPHLEQLEGYAAALRPHVTNPSLSTQRLRICGDAWLQIVAKNEGIAVAAHAFTPPHKASTAIAFRHWAKCLLHRSKSAG